MLMAEPSFISKSSYNEVTYTTDLQISSVVPQYHPYRRFLPRNWDFFSWMVPGMEENHVLLGKHG